MDTAAGRRIGLREEVITKACSIAMKAHKSCSGKPYLIKKSWSSTEVILGFTGSWVASDWLSQKPFGDTKINLDVFPSLRSITNDVAAVVKETFLRKFEELLANSSSFKIEVEKAAAERKQLVFTGHSSGAPLAIFATLWMLEIISNQKQTNQPSPYCVTFGSPLVGDRILAHAIARENWSPYFIHFTTRYDIIPRILLSPLPSITRELQPILDYLNPNSTLFASESISKAAQVLNFFMVVMRNTSYAANHAACKYMGCTNLLLETVTGVVGLSPFRPFGTYIFCAGQGRLLVLQNPDAVLQLLYYTLQIRCEPELAGASQRSLEEHLMYESQLQGRSGMQNLVYLDRLADLPLSADGGAENAAITTVLDDLGVSTRARLCLRAAGELEKQKLRNQCEINNQKNKIEHGLNMLESYKTNCRMHKLSYYECFKLQKEREDFESNVKRLELAGIWDEIIEMLKRYELPEGFEGQKRWIELGTRYRRIVEPLDIANYYRHSLNESTGPYMINGRPKRYRCTQRWWEHAEKLHAESIPESCFWAEVEELCISSSGYRDSTTETVDDRVLRLERSLLRWVDSGNLSKDVLLNDATTFVQWWKRLPYQHKSKSCIAHLFSG